MGHGNLKEEYKVVVNRKEKRVKQEKIKRTIVKTVPLASRSPSSKKLTQEKYTRNIQKKQQLIHKQTCDWNFSFQYSAEANRVDIFVPQLGGNDGSNFWKNKKEGDTKFDTFDKKGNLIQKGTSILYDANYIRMNLERALEHIKFAISNKDEKTEPRKVLLNTQKDIVMKV